MATVKRFEDLAVWQSARTLVNAIYDATKGRWFGEDKAFCWQIRDAAISAMSNIAEGFERGSNKEFIQALFISKGSAGEVRSDLYPALDQGFITKPQFDVLCEQCLGLSRQLMALAAYLRGSSYKGDKFHEARAVYEVSTPEPSETWSLDLPDLELGTLNSEP